ncbi:hypothetical protein FLONG3_6403 [Fusarium longipes]|uniref:Integral membrane n=1 Tax=Fusarium longipes TaxID=694270 RepID=A0A395SKX6_9HYPO|nr:hypothetical protein FLONG3_6403 [Fusarium longipes]
MDFLQSLLIESWILWVLGLFIVVCRLASRRLKLGKWSRLAIEDYLMVFALVNYTGVVVSINQVAENGSNYMPADVAAALTPEGKKKAIFGSKMTFVLEIFALTAVWTIKACLLFLYARLTQGTSIKQRWAVRRIGLCCVFGLGLFNILAAVLNRYYNFSNPNSYVFLYWYVAESGVALWVGNLPLCWPVLRLALGSKGDSSNPSYPNPSYRNSSYPENSARRRTQGLSKPSVWAKLEDVDGTHNAISADQGSQIELVEHHGQQQYFVEAKAGGGGNGIERETNGHITVVTNVEVSEGRI